MGERRLEREERGRWEEEEEVEREGERGIERRGKGPSWLQGGGGKQRYHAKGVEERKGRSPLAPVLRLLTSVLEREGRERAAAAEGPGALEEGLAPAKVGIRGPSLRVGRLRRWALPGGPAREGEEGGSARSS